MLTLLFAALIVTSPSQNGLNYGTVNVSPTSDIREVITLGCDNYCLGGVHEQHIDCTLSCDKPCVQTHEAVLVPLIKFDPTGTVSATASLQDDKDGLWKLTKGMQDVQNRLSAPMNVRLDHWNTTACSTLERKYGLRRYVISTQTPDGLITLGEAWLPMTDPIESSDPIVSCKCDSGILTPSLDDYSPSYPSGGFLLGGSPTLDWPEGVTAEIRGVNLNAVQLTLKNGSDNTLSGSVLPGTVFSPGDGSYQRMAASVRTPFELMPGAQLTLDIPALCLEKDKKEPDPSVAFNPEFLEDDIAASIIGITAESSFRGGWDQARIWVRTDGANAQQTNEVLFPPVTDMVYARVLSELVESGAHGLLRITPSLARGIPQKSLSEFVVSGLGNRPYASVLVETLELSSPTFADEVIESAKETVNAAGYQKDLAEWMYLGAISLGFSMVPDLQIIGLGTMGVINEKYPDLGEKYSGQSPAATMLCSPNAEVREKAAVLTGTTAPKPGLNVAILLGRSDPLLETGLACPEMTVVNPGLLGLGFASIDQEIVSLSLTSTVADVAVAFNTRVLPFGKWSVATVLSNGLSARIDTSGTNGALTEVNATVMSSAGAMEVMTIVVPGGDNSTVAGRQLTAAANRLNEARRKLNELIARQRRLRGESTTAQNHANELRCLDARYIDDLRSNYEQPINDAIDENKKLKAGLVQPDPAKLAKDLADVQKKSDDCEKELKALRDKKTQAEADRDDLKRQTDRLLNDAQTIFNANGYTGKHGYHSNGHYWWGYGRIGGAMPMADQRRISALRRQIRDLNRKYMDKLREVPGIEAAIQKKEAECAKRQKDLLAAQAAKDKSDQIGANDHLVGAASEDIGDRLDEAENALGDKNGDLRDQLEDVHDGLPEDSEGWDEFWDDLERFSRAKKAKEQELTDEADNKSAEASGLGNNEIADARTAVGKAKDKYNVQKKFAGKMASPDLKKLQDATTTDTPKSGKWDSVPVGNTRGHCEDKETTTGHTDYDYTLEGKIPGLSTEKGPDGLTRKTPCPAELVIYVHGFDNSDDDARENLEVVQKSLRKNGYTGPIMGWTWDSNPGTLYFDTAKAHSRINGKKLASFIRDYKKVCPDTKIRLIGHSMGCRVILEALKALDTDANFADWRSDGNKVESVHLMGAAVDNEEVQTDDEYGTAIENQAGWLYNYWNDEDDVLSNYYGIEEFDQALGEDDIEDDEKAPKNYSSRDVKSEISRDTDGDGDNDESNLGDNHSGYNGVQDKNGKLTSDGCIDKVTEDFNRHPTSS